MSDRPDNEPSVGPHEGRELDLMLAGRKPLSMFSSVTNMDEWPDEATFDEVVASGRLTKAETKRVLTCRDSSTAEARCLLCGSR